MTIDTEKFEGSYDYAIEVLNKTLDENIEDRNAQYFVTNNIDAYEEELKAYTKEEQERIKELAKQKDAVIVERMQRTDAIANNISKEDRFEIFNYSELKKAD